MQRLKGKLIPVLLLAFLAGGVVIMVSNSNSGKSAGALRVTIPELSPVAVNGQTLFNANCAQCHGKGASGSENGPPLIHKIYEPNHHGDASFLNAAARGVRSHHWQFGDMLPVEGVNRQDVLKIVRYIREVQKANGIF